MHLFLKLLIVFLSLEIGLLIADDNIIKVPTKAELQQMFEKANELNTSEMQEAKKAANYFKTLIQATQDAGVPDGYQPTREQELVIMDNLFPFAQEDALKKGKIRVEFSTQCFSKADTLKKANQCNEQANKLSGFIIESFTKWDNNIKQETLKNIKQYIPCIENAKTAEELNSCYMHIYK